ncbi:MAG: SDR family oxidoreductase [Dehalococcoidales bacterium]|nr:SDR family oxidoreductase [Dehalococcoidales bacterium]
MLLQDKVAIVTGGAQGIGKGIALKFAGEGCSVAIADINSQESSSTLKQITDLGSEGLVIHCDVTDSKQVKNTVQQVLGKFGKIDILVNNAGGMPSAPPLEEINDDLWDTVINLNLKSLFLFCRSVIPLMKEKRYGKVINFSSMGAINPPKHSIHYNSAKAGVLGFTYDLAYTVAPFNINVNVIVPGLIHTSFYNSLAGLNTEQQKEDFFNTLGQMVPLQRIGTPEDIAGAALFLASDLSSYVTGTSLLVSGGLPLQPQPSKPSNA